MPNDNTENKNTAKDPPRKYANFAQLVQGVSQVDSPTLEPTDRLFLNCLAAHNLKENPHPGNKRLMRACGVASRQSVNKIARRLLDKKLIEIIERGDGRGNATIYRICTEDDRFPWPEMKNKPATLELPVSGHKPATLEASVSENKPATEKPETRNAPSRNPQLDHNKPATATPETRNSRGSYEFKPSNTISNTTPNTTRGEPEPKSSPVYAAELERLLQEQQEQLSFFQGLIKSGQLPGPLLDAERRGEFKKECLAIGVPWDEVDGLWQKLIHPFLDGT